MSSPIPTRSRNIVKRRELGQCFRCGGRGAEWHHRRSRSVRDTHQHCPCNGLWLCQTCHRWVHAHPFEARGDGLIVSRSVAEPFAVKAKAYYGEVLLPCQGAFDAAPEEEVEMDGEVMSLERGVDE